MRQTTSPINLIDGHINRLANQPIISVKRTTWRKDDDHADAADVVFMETRKNVFQRDNYTCRYCTFKASKYKEVHHVDDDHKNNELSNLITVCNLCHQVFHLGMCAMRNSGFIAAIPEITQTEINNIMRSIYVAEFTGNTQLKDKMKSLYALFQYRGMDTLKNLYGIDISTPYALAEVLSTCPDDIFNQRGKIFASLRVVPTKEAFHAGQIEFYAVNQKALFDPKQWETLRPQLIK